MSVWTEVKGRLEIPFHAHFSVDKSIKESFESSKSFCVYTGGVVNLTFSFVEDGLCAAKQIQNWVDKLPKGSKVDIEANIRFLR